MSLMQHSPSAGRARQLCSFGWGLNCGDSGLFRAGPLGWALGVGCGQHRPALTSAGTAQFSSRVIVEDQLLGRRGRCATPALGSCRSPCSLLLLRCPWGWPSGPCSWGARTAAVRLSVSEQPERAPLWAEGGAHVGL